MEVPLISLAFLKERFSVSWVLMYSLEKPYSLNTKELALGTQIRMTVNLLTCLQP